MGTRDEILRMIAEAYKKATKKEKGHMLDHVVEIAGYNRASMPPTAFSCPVRTFADWDDARPGFMEMDMVAHEGGNPSGEYALTLNLTDVSSGWTELRAVKNKAQKWVFEALGLISKQIALPAARPGLGQ